MTVKSLADCTKNLSVLLQPSEPISRLRIKQSIIVEYFKYKEYALPKFLAVTSIYKNTMYIAATKNETYLIKTFL